MPKITLRPPGSKTIIVVDDSEISREIAKIILEANGYQVICLANPYDIFDALKSVSPVLILMDVQMPEANGDAMADFLNGEVECRCPIVLFSASSSEAELREKTRRAGAAGYIMKSSDHEAFAAAINRFVG